MHRISMEGMASIGKAHLRTRLPGRGMKHEKTEVDNVQMFDQFTNELVEFLVKHADQRKRVETNPDWSEAGKAKKLKEIDDQFRPQLDDFRRRMTGIKDKLRQDRAGYEVKPFTGTGNPVLDELRAQEVRRYLLGMEPGQRIEFAMNPDNDPLIIWAVKNSPIPIPELNAEMMARVEAHQVEKLNPEGTLLGQDHELLLETMEYNMSEVVKVFAVPQTEPVIVG